MINQNDLDFYEKVSKVLGESWTCRISNSQFIADSNHVKIALEPSNNGKRSVFISPKNSRNVSMFSIDVDQSIDENIETILTHAKKIGLSLPMSSYFNSSPQVETEIKSKQTDSVDNQFNTISEAVMDILHDMVTEERDEIGNGLKAIDNALKDRGYEVIIKRK